MRKLLLLISLTLTTATSFGQLNCGGIAQIEEWNFDDGQQAWSYVLQIDTISNPNNIWQIGVPQKNVIDSAYSLTNVIITDTINHYPQNDTSSFMFISTDYGGFEYQHTVELAGYYNVNSDSLNDYGTIEISFDQGTSWVNLITDTIYTPYYSWVTEEPTLTGKSDGWQNFWITLEGLGNPFQVSMGDTILLKFTFISDSIADTLDGLAYDNFQFCNGVESVEEILDNNLITVYPNPTTNFLYINRKQQQEKEVVQIFNYNGQRVFEDNNFNSRLIVITELNLTDGLYFLKYSDTKSYAIKRFIVQH